MSLDITKQRFLVPSEEVKIDIKEGSSKLVNVIKKLIADVEAINEKKSDVTNLKNSYIAFSQDTNSNLGILNERLNAIEGLLKKLVSRLDELENI